MDFFRLDRGACPGVGPCRLYGLIAEGIGSGALLFGLAVLVLEAREKARHFSRCPFGGLLLLLLSRLSLSFMSLLRLFFSRLFKSINTSEDPEGRKRDDDRLRRAHFGTRGSSLDAFWCWCSEPASEAVAVAAAAVAASIHSDDRQTIGETD